MSSFSMSGFATNTSHHLLQSLDHFNACVSTAEAISIDEMLNSPTNQKMLSTKIENKPWAPPAFLEGGGQSGKGGANWEGEGGG